METVWKLETDNHELGYYSSLENLFEGIKSNYDYLIQYCDFKEIYDNIINGAKKTIETLIDFFSEECCGIYINSYYLNQNI